MKQERGEHFLPGRLAWGLLVILSAAGARADILMTPYLQAATKNSIQVVVECNSTASATVEYGLTSSYGNTAITEKYENTTGGTYAQSIRLTGLQANTVYHYHVKQGASTSADATFRTAPLPGTPFRFAWLADNRGNQSQYDAILNHIKAANPSLILHGGDIASDGSYANIKSEFFTPTALSIYSQIPFVLTIGNHEQWTQDPMAFVEAPISASNTQDYYSLDYGDMHLLVMLLYTGENTYYDLGPTSAQYAFAQSDLSSTRQQWKIVIAHKTPYAASDPNGGGHPEATELFPITQGVYQPNKVDAWIGGHNHYYQHNIVNGIHYVIIGSCAAELYVPTTASYTVKSAQTYCYGIIDVSPTDFNIAVYDGNGSVIDNVNLHKSPASIVPQPADLPGSDYRLEQNYPNPFNPSTEIHYTLKDDGYVRLEVMDVLGRVVGVPVSGRQLAGAHSIAFSGQNLPSGVYLYRLQTANFSQTKRMVLLR